MNTKTGVVLLLLALAFAAAACSKSTTSKLLSTEVATPAKLATALEVKGCRPMGEVKGYAEPTRSGNIPLARITARDSMLTVAGEKGATHVVFKKFLGNRRAMALGEAYRCE